MSTESIYGCPFPTDAFTYAVGKHSSDWNGKEKNQLFSLNGDVGKTMASDIELLFNIRKRNVAFI